MPFMRLRQTPLADGCRRGLLAGEIPVSDEGVPAQESLLAHRARPSLISVLFDPLFRPQATSLVKLPLRS